jgi:N4-gp56 family major capsid protein
MSVQVTGSLSAETKTFYDRSLLEAAKPTLLHDRWGQKRPIPQREGQVINFRRFEILDPATTALQEGVTPAGSDLSISSVTATPSQYGDFVTVSDYIDWTGIDPVLTETAELLGVQAGETIDELCRDVLVAGTSVRYANARTVRTDIVAGDIVNGTELRKVRRTLRKNLAKPVEDGCFVMIISPDTHYDLQTMTEWQGMGQYSQPEQLKSGAVKKMWGFCFYETDKAKVFTGGGSGGADVHASVALGKDFYGNVGISGHMMETIMKPLGSAGSADPLNQRATAGWKATYVAVRLNESFAVRLEHGVTG